MSWMNDGDDDDGDHDAYKYMGAGGTDHHVFTVLCFDLPNQISSGQVAP